jgi:hypothetical protein
MSAKRSFRRKVADRPDAKPAYPTLETFDQNRRQFLARLGGFVGASVLAACGGRNRTNPPFPGVQRAPDARVDDGGSDAEADFPEMAGTALPPPARLDAGPDTSDAKADPDSWELAGVDTPPDARADTATADTATEQDLSPLAGEPMMPDARVDEGKR